MSTEHAIPPTDEPTTTQDTPDTPSPPAVDPEIEAEARSNGWRSRDEHRGPPEEWVDAATFVTKSRQINPILRKNNERLRAELNEAKSRLDEQGLTIKQFATEFAKMKDNAYKRAIADLRAQRRDALQSDNLELVDDLEDRIDSLKAEQSKQAEPPKPETPKAPPPPDMSIFNEWHAENRWFDESKHPELFEIAEEIADRLTRTQPTLKGREFLDTVTRKVKARYPDHFTNPRRSSSPHEGGGPRGESKSARSYASLPPDAKKACDDYVKQGILTREQYIDAYPWDE